MPYPRKNLNEGETIALDMHPHWWYFWEPALTLIAILIVGIILLVVDTPHWFSTGAKWLVIIAIVLSACWLVSRYMKWISTNFVITSNRIIFRQGIVSKSGVEIPLDRVNNVNFHQTILERVLGAGDLLIESGGEDGQSRFTDIRHPDRVQNLIHAEMEGHAKRRGSYSTGGYVSSNMPPPAPVDVAGQLERLEGMLQRGTLTSEEFQAQKRKLLGS
ncbi:MAG: PH domain-containing protein [Ilumatobacteraceae bacterium]